MDQANANLGGIELNANRYKYFKWTPRNAWLTLLYVGIVPGIIGYVAYSTDVSGPHFPARIWMDKLVCDVMEADFGALDIGKI